jgi:hypothetical protein
MPVIPTLEMLRKEDHKFKASLCYKMRICVKEKKKIHVSY